MTKHILQRNRYRNLQSNFVDIKMIQEKEKNKQTKKATSDQNIWGGKDGDPHKVEREKKARWQGWERLQRATPDLKQSKTHQRGKDFIKEQQCVAP